MRMWRGVGCAVLAALGVCAQGVVAQTEPAAQPIQLIPQLPMGLVSAVAFSPNGRLLLTAIDGFDGNPSVRLWEVSSGLVLRTFVDSDSTKVLGRVTAIGFSPDATKVLTADDKGIIQIWNAATGQLEQNVHAGDDVDDIRQVALSADNLRLLAREDKRDLVWGDPPAADEAAAKKQFEATVLRIVQDNTPWGWKADANGVYTPWNVTTNSAGPALAVKASEWEAHHITRDGRYALLSSRTGMGWSVWDFTKGARILTVTNEGDAADLSPDGRLLALVEVERVGVERKFSQVVLWNVATGTVVQRLEGTTKEASMRFLRDGRILERTPSGTWRIWDLAAGRPEPLLLGDAQAGTMNVEASPDGTMVLTYGSDGKDTAIKLWDVKTEVLLRTMKSAEPVKVVKFSADGMTIFSSGEKGPVRIFVAETGEQTHVLRRSDLFDVSDFAVSSDGSSVFTLDRGGNAGYGKDPVIRKWNLATNLQVHSYANVARYQTESFLSGDGRIALIDHSGEPAGGEDFELRDSTTGRKLLQIGSDGPLSEGLLRDVRGGGTINSVEFVPGDDLMLTAEGDGTARIWDLKKGEAVIVFTGHNAQVKEASFSPDPHVVLTSSEDGTSRLWDLTTRKELATLMTYGDNEWAVVTADGRFDGSNLASDVPLHWVLPDDPMRALPLEIFMRDYYTPGLLARVMKGEKLPEVRSITKIEDRVQPEVKVVSVMASEKMSGRLDVTVHAASATDEKGVKSGLQDLRLFRDGQMVADGYRIGPLADGDFVFRDVMLKSDAKKATFTAYAFNSERIKSATASLEYDVATPVSAAAKRRAYLLQVGVNHTAAAGCELSYSVNDAEMMSAALSERLKTQGFEVVAVKLESATGSDASGAAKGLIRDGLKKIAAEATPDDVFFMSFSGHGYAAADGAFYILPSSLEGSCLHANATLLGSAISADELGDWLRPIDAGEMTLILDACHSAESVQAGDFRPGPMGSQGLGQVAYDKRMRVLAASQSDAVAYEFDYLHQGLLSYVLVKDGLDKDLADWKPKDGKITVGEWLSYAAAAVPEFKPSTSAGGNKGTTVEKKTDETKPARQVPALFDFSRGDALVLTR